MTTNYVITDDDVWWTNIRTGAHSLVDFTALTSTTDLVNFRQNQAGLVKISRQGGLEKIHFQQFAPLILYIYGDVRPSTLRKKY